MMERLKARKAEIARLREERGARVSSDTGATDPILIIAGIAITLILLVGGSFAISGFIANANNLNAKGDLDRVATAQAAYMVANDGYGSFATGPSVVSQDTELQDAAIGFTPTAGNNIKVRSSPAGWTAVTRSASGDIFARSSESAETFQISGGQGADPAGYTAWAETSRNLFRNPSFENGLSGVSFNRVTGVQSAAGAISGSSALALTRTSDSNADAYADIASMVDGGVGSLKPNTTYTITATYTLSSPLTSVPAGATTGLTQRLSVFVHLNGNQRLTLEGTNSAGTRTLTGTFTTPAVMTGFNTIRLYAGDAASSPQRVTWDSVGLYEGNHTSVGFYDGSTAAPDALTRYTWLGTPGNSVSARETRSLLPGAGQVWLPSAQPSGFSLPAGISWDDVVADLREVHS